jgi:BirA family biotin operon repressor/biotin-[acetyl-CoA-carboxylase] ligase
VAGTLIQNGIKGSQFEFSVVGIGLNVNQEAFHSDATNPVSLKMISGQEFELGEVLGLSLEKIEERYLMLKKGNRQLIDEDYLKMLYRINEISDYVYRGNPLRAKITGVNKYGHLILEIPGEKIIECDLKEIRNGLPSSSPP